MNVRRFGLLVLLVTFVLAWDASAVCSTCGNSLEQQQAAVEAGWATFLGTALGAQTINQIADGSQTGPVPANNSEPENASQTEAAIPVDQRSGSLARVLVPLSAVGNQDVILDISPSATEYIQGAVAINYETLLDENKRLRPASELARLFGDAGISENDSVLIYGECQPCGGGPSAATYVYWAMKYLGHQRVQVLDGGIDDWVAASMPTEAEPATLPPVAYRPTIRPELMASYEYVVNGQAQIVDARTAPEFEAGSVPGAINIPYENVLDEKKIKDQSGLEQTFAALTEDRPVVVYTNTGVKASMVWFALSLMGYDARLFTWQDWLENQPTLGIRLQNVSALPNPAQTGSVVTITAVFAEKSAKPLAEPLEDAVLSAENASENATNNTILTIKGCATCGFGSPQGFADISSDSGIVQIGSTTRTVKANASDNGFSCSGRITTQSGTQVAKVIMKRVSGDEFSGIWNANVASGNYSLTLEATGNGITETFANVLQIEIVPPASKYKNLGKYN